jgi:hypothetical protein
VLRAHRVEERVDLVERVEEGRVRPVRGRRRAELEPREPGRRGERAPRQHREESTLRVEVGQQATEIALVGAEPVEQQQDPLGIRTADDVVDQHRSPPRVHPGGRDCLANSPR